MVRPIDGLEEFATDITGDIARLTAVSSLWGGSPFKLPAMWAGLNFREPRGPGAKTDFASGLVAEATYADVTSGYVYGAQGIRNAFWTMSETCADRTFEKRHINELLHKGPGKGYFDYSDVPSHPDGQVPRVAIASLDNLVDKSLEEMRAGRRRKQENLRRGPAVPPIADPSSGGSL